MRSLESRSIDADASFESYLDVRSLTEQLSSPLSAEDQTIQSMPDVSPTKWHRAHTSWFFEEFVLAPNDPSYTWFDERYRFLFNSYYEAVGPRHPRPERGVLSRPSVSDVGTYRRYVDEAMSRLLDRSQPPEVLEFVELGLHHEQQHQELLLMDIKHVLAQNPLRPAYGQASPKLRAAAPPLDWLDHLGGLVEIGHDGEGFSYDNERARHLVQLRPFSLASRLVTNGEWKAFMDDGGYRRPDLWLSEGWGAVNAEGWEAPLYWERDEADWGLFTLGGQAPVDDAQPVCHVSYFEADAYARWAGARLPTEAEWEALASDVPPVGRFLDPGVLHPVAADGTGPLQLFGDVWEWTASAYLPYPGFEPPPGAVGEYNGKFMVNQHVLRGGSCVSPLGHVRLTYRNFFPPASRWVFSGVRLARG